MAGYSAAGCVCDFRAGRFELRLAIFGLQLDLRVAKNEVHFARNTKNELQLELAVWDEKTSSHLPALMPNVVFLVPMQVQLKADFSSTKSN